MLKVNVILITSLRNCRVKDNITPLKAIENETLLLVASSSNESETESTTDANFKNKNQDVCNL